MRNGSAHGQREAPALGSLLLGESRPLQRLRSLIVRLAASDSPVLIEGPTGSGKELVAEALHLCSGRHGPFVPFNVCAIADGTLESELFGHVRGAFTGALQDRDGYLAEAHQGTVFFDEISSLSTSAQAKLLRAIETHSFRPVGARNDRTSDFRVVAASNEDLAGAVGEGRFRLDLYHRLRAFLIRVPPLREHIEDVPLLARHFARRAAVGGGSLLTDDAIARLMDHSWPGNVRELRNVVEFAMALAGGAVVDSHEVGEALGCPPPRPAPDRANAMRHRLVALLVDCRWNTVEAAARLGVHRSNVYRMMRRFGISPRQRRHLECDLPFVIDGHAELRLLPLESGSARSVHSNGQGLRAAGCE